MAHQVVRIVNGRKYLYEETSYRVPGLRTPRKRSTYLGPVDPVYEDAGGHKRKKGIFRVLDELVRKKRDWETPPESEEQVNARIASEEKDRERTSRNNDLLTGKSISLDELAEVAASQSSDKEAESAPAASGEASEASSSDASDGDAASA